MADVRDRRDDPDLGHAVRPDGGAAGLGVGDDGLIERREALVRYGLAGLIVFLTAVILLGGILLPFVVGLGAAYLFDPAADRLQRLGVSRTTAALVVTLTFFAVLAAFVVVLLPLLLDQALGLIQQLPSFFEAARERVWPTVQHFMQSGPWRRLFAGQLPSVSEIPSGISDRVVSIVTATLSSLLQQGVAIINLLSLIFVTPLVTFYLLRDWDRLMGQIRRNIPPDMLPTTDALAREVDDVMAGFFRGQGLVCLFLGLFYALGLWLTGLQYGVIIGLLTGFVSFVPYVGMAVGAAVGLLVAAFQFQTLLMLGVVAGVFALGQFIEGNFVTPWLVGARIRLHPVWVIFAVLAATVLFGLVGTLLAVPVTGVLAVFIRYGARRYRGSRLYHNHSNAA